MGVCESERREYGQAGGVGVSESERREYGQAGSVGVGESERRGHGQAGIVAGGCLSFLVLFSLCARKSITQPGLNS